MPTLPRQRKTDGNDPTNCDRRLLGSYATHPFTGELLPIWISDYVLAGYGTGAIMAVPAHDSRDYAFARHFNLPIIPLIEGCDVSEESFDAKEGIMMNSGFLNGMTVKQAIPAAINEVEKLGLGYRKINYRLRDAIFSRQRYWGEPFLSITRMVCPIRSTIASCHWSYQRWISSCRQKRVNHRWGGHKTGKLERVILSN